MSRLALSLLRENSLCSIQGDCIKWVRSSKLWFVKICRVFKIWQILIKSSSMCKIWLKNKLDSRLSLQEWHCHLHLQVFSWVAGEEWHHSKHSWIHVTSSCLSVSVLLRGRPGMWGHDASHFLCWGDEKRGNMLWKINCSDK